MGGGGGGGRGLRKVAIVCQHAAVLIPSLGKYKMNCLRTIAVVFSIVGYRELVITT